jgi:predicted porin
LLAASASAQAGITIPAGDWTLDVGGVVNAYYTSTRGTGSAVTGGLGGPNATGERTESNITTGLLPNVLSISGKSRQNDLDIGFTIAINPGASTVRSGIQTSAQANSNQENRQAFLTIGDASWGSVKLGKDIGIFASDAILNDMTLLGVGSAGGLLAGNTTTLGRIGTGFIYTDWKAQVAYTSPNWNGFQFTAGATQAWNAIATGTSGTSSARGGSAPAFEAKASYSWTGDVAGKVWVSAMTQKVESVGSALRDETARGWDIGANINMGAFGLTGYYYDAKGLGTTVQLRDGFDLTGKRRDSDGGYVQATYVIPAGTKLGVSWGKSNLDLNSGEAKNALVEENRMWTVGAYHPLTKSVNLVAEYSDVKAEAQNGVEGKSRTVSAGAILFF